MITPEQRQQALAFLSTHPVAVLATADVQANPAAAVVLFAETDDLEIIFATHPTRKYQNLKATEKAAFAFTKDWMAIQMHGQATELSGAESDSMKDLFIKKHPEFDVHLMEGSLFFRFTPAWMRYMDNGTKPPTAWEGAL